MARPYQYKQQYQYGQGVLGEGRKSQKKAIKKAKGMLGDYDAGATYDEQANKSLYIVRGAGGKHNKTTGELERLAFNQEQLDKIIPALGQTYSDTHGGINTRKIDKKLLQGQLDTVSGNEDAWYEQFVKNKSYHAKYDPRSQVGSLYSAGVVNDKFIQVERNISGESEIELIPIQGDGKAQIDELRGKYRYIEIIEKENRAKSIKNYKSNLQSLLKADDDAYFTYLAPQGEKGSDRAYGQLQESLYNAASSSKIDYVNEVNAQLDNERAQVEEIERQNRDRIAKRQETYSRLFKQGNSKRYI